MKVLDLGAHDGYVTAWLREQLPDVEVDGVELMPEAAAKARERGINCKVGAAEDAPNLFEPVSYDAVVMFELIEHVPDVDRLLAAAEVMLKPDGQVYVSTPDGTFGEGHNPHHLRALRALDLADLCRRRGRLEDMMVGSDTVSVARYTPTERLGEVAVFTGPSWMKWSPVDMLTKGLGGSETAAARLSEALSELGYIVTVYGDVEECAFKDVIFRRWEAFDPTQRRQAVISSRMPELFDRPIAADTRLLWLHDTDCGDRLTEHRAERIDRVLTLSKWHRRHVEGLYPFIAGRPASGGRAPSKIVQIRNGIERRLFAGEPLTRRKRVVYTSSPDRGLDLLLEMWPEIRERVPDAELAYAYSPVYWEIAEQDPTVGAHAQRVRELSEQDGVEFVGALSQLDVARLMRSSLVWCAPSYNTPHDAPFHETSCIGAMEAQAAGCLVVASDWGALPETVRIGHLVNSDAPGPRWREAFIEHIVEGLTNEETQAWAQAHGPAAAAELGWDGVAADVAKLIEGEAL